MSNALKFGRPGSSIAITITCAAVQAPAVPKSRGRSPGRKGCRSGCLPRSEASAVGAGMHSRRAAGAEPPTKSSLRDSAAAAQAAAGSDETASGAAKGTSNSNAHRSAKVAPLNATQSHAAPASPSSPEAALARRRGDPSSSSAAADYPLLARGQSMSGSSSAVGSGDSELLPLRASPASSQPAAATRGNSSESASASASTTSGNARGASSSSSAPASRTLQPQTSVGNNADDACQQELIYSISVGESPSVAARMPATWVCCPHCGTRR